MDQIAVLKAADIFITHCGMNSASEGLYFGVPLVMFPQTAEQGGVANRVAQLGAGEFLKNNAAEQIRSTVESVVKTSSYKECAENISEGFKRSGGAKAAADAIISFIDE